MTDIQYTKSIPVRHDVDVLVDGTGDGDLGVMAGAEYDQGDAEGAMMPGTLCSLWGGVDWNAVAEGGLGKGNKRIEDAFSDGVPGLIISRHGIGVAVFGGLVILGMFFWPIIILCVALGGFDFINHPGLILSTIVKTFPAYLFTVIMVFGVDWLGHALTGAVDTRLAPGDVEDVSIRLGSSILVSFFVTGITVYFEIVTMKLIGLYYHHFKDRFAWDWG